MIVLVFLVVIVGACASAYVASEVAISKKWNGFPWMMLDFFFGPLGVIGAAGLPDRQIRKTLRLLAEKQGIEVTAPEF